MNTSKYSRILQIIKIIILIVFVILLLGKAFSSLNWRMSHDTPMLHYVAFLMDKHDLVPYIDIFETSMPGTFAFHYSIVKLFGYSDLAFRYVDLVLLTFLLGVTYLFMRRFGKIVGAMSAVLFGLIYLSNGQSMSLQKDYVGIIPIALALLCIPTSKNTQNNTTNYEKPIKLIRFALIGFLFGLAILIKPHLAIGFPIIFGAVISFRWQLQQKTILDFIKCSMVSTISLLIPISIACMWLSAHSALSPFFDIFINYLPLHASITGGHQTIFGYERISYLIISTLMFGGYLLLLLTSISAFCYIWPNLKDKKPTMISLTSLGLCTLVYAIYPTLAGKFWSYHYMPFAYFCSIATSLCFFSPQSDTLTSSKNLRNELFLVLALVFVVSIQLPLPAFINSTFSDIKSSATDHSHAPMGGRTDEIAEWLTPRLQANDTVQTLDWTGGSVHALLLSKARLATNFLYDYHFYHHISLPYIQVLRKIFMKQIKAKAPRFIIYVETFKPWVTGKDTTKRFPELENFIVKKYNIAFKGYGYTILEVKK